jgi:hypothetical protein
LTRLPKIWKNKNIKCFIRELAVQDKMKKNWQFQGQEKNQLIRESEHFLLLDPKPGRAMDNKTVWVKTTKTAIR